MKPIVFLNAWQYGKTSLVRLVFKHDKELIELLKSKGYIRYSYGFRCFYFVHNEMNLEKIKTDLYHHAQVNKEYLIAGKKNEKENHADSKKPITPAAEIMKKVVYLLPTTVGNKFCTKLSFKYDKDIYKIIRSSKIALWSKETLLFIHNLCNLRQLPLQSRRRLKLSFHFGFLSCSLLSLQLS